MPQNLIDSNPIRKSRLQRIGNNNPYRPHDYSLRSLAEKLGVNFRHIERWERGESIPSVRNAEKLARLLGFESAEQLRAKARSWQRQHAPDHIDTGREHRSYAS